MKHSLYFEKSIRSWDEGIPLGNGRLGALIWGGPEELRFSLDRTDIWDLSEPLNTEREDFTYQNPLDKFKIVMPKESSELIEEGSFLGHCVASYIEKVVAGDCLVVFMSEKESLETPYLTVEILPDRTVPQVEGLNKRSELTEDEILFLNRWAKNKNLKITAKNAIMDKKKVKEIA